MLPTGHRQEFIAIIPGNETRGRNANNNVHVNNNVYEQQTRTTRPLQDHSWVDNTRRQATAFNAVNNFRPVAQESSWGRVPFFTTFFAPRETQYVVVDGTRPPRGNLVFDLLCLAATITIIFLIALAM